MRACSHVLVLPPPRPRSGAGSPTIERCTRPPGAVTRLSVVPLTKSEAAPYQLLPTAGQWAGAGGQPGLSTLLVQFWGTMRLPLLDGVSTRRVRMQGVGARRFSLRRKAELAGSILHC